MLLATRKLPSFRVIVINIFCRHSRRRKCASTLIRNLRNAAQMYATSRCLSLDYEHSRCYANETPRKVYRYCILARRTLHGTPLTLSGISFEHRTLTPSFDCGSPSSPKALELGYGGRIENRKGHDFLQFHSLVEQVGSYVPGNELLW